MEIERFVSEGTAPPVFAAVRGIPDMAVEPLPEGVTCLVARERGRPVARLGLYLREDLVGAPGRSGLIGHYEALDRDAGVALLGAACRELVDHGAARVLGPMNGSTWMRYRLALPPAPGDPSGAPPFFAGEPRNPFDYPEHFEAASFAVVARYESRTDDLAAEASDAGAVAVRFSEGGFSLRPLDVARFDAELETLYALSLESFVENLFYSPIDEATFRALYQPLRPLMDAGFVSIALDRVERPCGYLFAHPDPSSLRDGRPARLIAKTVAVAPRARGHGVANHLLDRIRGSARSRGYRQTIHALMHVTNLSTRMSARHGSEVFRRYALWEWRP